MSLGYQKSQRHAGRDRVIKDRLKSHAEWMAYFEAGGYTREAASQRAMEKVKAGENLKLRDAE